MSKNKQQYLFLFTIGPVQSFIAQARKTQDLFAGSQILSELVKVGIKAIPKWDDNVIYPVLDKNTTIQSLPNRFISIVEKPQEELKNLGENIEDIVRNRFEDIANKSLEQRKKPVGFDEQIERHLDIHWVFHPLKEDYQQSYQEIEALLGSIKNIRPFNQFGNGVGEKGRKCSLDGENNALFFGRKKPSLSIETQRNNSTTIKGFLTDEKEGLSAVSFVKRYGVAANSFSSTAQIAVSYDESQLASEQKEIFQYFKKLYGNEKEIFEVCSAMINKKWIASCNIKELNNDDRWNKHFDYQPLFEENLTEKALPNKEQLRLAKVLQSKLSSNFKTRYYAIILFDGDEMGKKLSKATSSNQHKDFSELLTLFAGEARKILKDKGQTVYVGGDDFLGFVNLHHLFEVMTELRSKFKTLVSDEAKKVLNLTDDFTFSAGIVIAHYKMPLSEVLKTVRKVEKKAKRDGNRNAFCITAIRHSGEIQEAIFKWEEITEKFSLWQSIEYISKQISNDTFSNKFITSLTQEMYQLSGVDLKDIVLMHKNKDLAEKALFTEFKRLVKRALIDTSGTKEDKEKRVKNLCKPLEILYLNRVPNKKEKDVFKGIQNFVHALQIADFLSRKIG